MRLGVLLSQLAGAALALHNVKTPSPGISLRRRRRDRGYNGRGVQMPRPPFEIMEHTADAGIVAHAGSLEELFANAAAGMFSLMADLDSVHPAEQRDIAIEARAP